MNQRHYIQDATTNRNVDAAIGLVVILGLGYVACRVAGKAGAQSVVKQLNNMAVGIKLPEGYQIVKAVV